MTGFPETFGFAAAGLLLFAVTFFGAVLGFGEAFAAFRVFGFATAVFFF
jgi:hypothetical protein